MKNVVFLFDDDKTISYALFKCLSDEICIKKEIFIKSKIIFFLKKFKLYPRQIIRMSINYNELKNKVVFFTNESLIYMSKKRLLKIKKISKKIVLFYIDGYQNKYPSIANAKKLDKYFDYVYTYSNDDALKYNFNYNNSYYHKYDFESVEKTSDLFLICNPKNRFDTILKIAKESVNNNLNINFNLNTTNYVPEYINKISFIKYYDSIKMLNESNCILDIVNPGDCGISLRYFEAICYNKKLLTNNKKVFELPYYDERYIKYFDDETKIDWSWVRERTNVDYFYNGEFEPINFIKRVLLKIGEGEKNYE